MNGKDTLMNKPCQDFYNRLAWVMFDMSSRQFLIAWRKWNQRRKEKKSPRARIQQFLKRLT